VEEDKYYKKIINERFKEGKIIAYIDEVGTGAIFGDVVVGCVVLKRGFKDRRINDSKKVKPDMRKKLTKVILKVLGISAASIIAKVYRDTYIVEEISKKFPHYNLESNKGYRSPHHLMAIRKYGVTEYHRSYMKQIKKVLDGKYDEIIESKYKERYKDV